MEQPKPTGTRNLCGKRFARALMTLHSKSCGPPLAEHPTGSTDIRIHLSVEARYNKLYWMHPAMLLEAALRKLDAFQRNIRLECCGHLSAFRIAGMEYASAPMREFGQAGMGAKANLGLYPGLSFFYEYDFGSTPEISLKVIGPRNQATKKTDYLLPVVNSPRAGVCAYSG